MKSTLVPVAFLALLGSFPSSTIGALVFARTIQGQALCAKHELRETQECQTAIRVVTDRNSVIYYADPNRIERESHAELCQSNPPATATGTVWERGGKRHMGLMHIEVTSERSPDALPAGDDSAGSSGGPTKNQSQIDAHNEAHAAKTDNQAD